MIGIIGYQAGNIHSVMSAVEAVGGKPLLVTSTKDFSSCRGVIFPGVGSFPSCAERLKAQGLWDSLREVAQKLPFLGICLGFQLLFDYGEEHGGAEGLGIFRGRVTRFSGSNDKVPHIGWNTVEVVRPSTLFPSTREDWFYFVHSYAPEEVMPEEVTAWCTYDGRRFPVAVERGDLFGVQFHPEKSQCEGLRIVERFVERCGC